MNKLIVFTTLYLVITFLVIMTAAHNFGFGGAVVAWVSLGILSYVLNQATQGDNNE